MKTTGLTDIGRVRGINQDSFLCMNNDNCSVLAVSDGMGGHNAGEVASAFTIEELEMYFSNKGADYLNLTEKIVEYIKKINLSMYEKSMQIAALNGMGTTLTLCVADEARSVFFQVGDSRAYIFSRADNSLRKITRDHSLVQLMLDSRQITEEEARVHPKRNIITRALGTSGEIEVDVYEETLSPTDLILLCSDGLSNMLSDEDIISAIGGRDIYTAAEALIKKANEAGGTDNITAVLCEG